MARCPAHEEPHRWPLASPASNGQPWRRSARPVGAGRRRPPCARAWCVRPVPSHQPAKRPVTNPTSGFSTERANCNAGGAPRRKGPNGRRSRRGVRWGEAGLWGQGERLRKDGRALTAGGPGGGTRMAVRGAWGRRGPPCGGRWVCVQFSLWARVVRSPSDAQRRRHPKYRQRPRACSAGVVLEGQCHRGCRGGWQFPVVVERRSPTADQASRPPPAAGRFGVYSAPGKRRFQQCQGDRSARTPKSDGA